MKPPLRSFEGGKEGKTLKAEEGTEGKTLMAASSVRFRASAVRCRIVSIGRCVCVFVCVCVCCVCVWFLCS